MQIVGGIMETSEKFTEIRNLIMYLRLLSPQPDLSCWLTVSWNQELPGKVKRTHRNMEMLAQLFGLQRRVAGGEHCLGTLHSFHFFNSITTTGDMELPSAAMVWRKDMLSHRICFSYCFELQTLEYNMLDTFYWLLALTWAIELFSIFLSLLQNVTWATGPCDHCNLCTVFIMPISLLTD